MTVVHGDRGGEAREAPGQSFDLFVIYARADAAFVREYLVPALDLPAPRVRLIGELPPGAVLVAALDESVEQSRFTLVVLSPSFVACRWAVYGEQLASHAHRDTSRLVPLLLSACALPQRLAMRVVLDFTDRSQWPHELARLRGLLHAAPPGSESIARVEPDLRRIKSDERRRLGYRQGVALAACVALVALAALSWSYDAPEPAVVAARPW